MIHMARTGVRNLRRMVDAAGRRFPLALSCAAIATPALVLVVDSRPSGMAARAAWRIFAAAAFGFPLFFSLKMFAERKAWKPVVLNAARAAVVLLAAACSFTLPQEPTAPAAVRFVLYCMGFFPVVTLAPFPGRGEINGFWHYNRALLVRLLLALLVTQALFAGIGLFVAGIDSLFGIGVPVSVYFRLWVVSSVLIGPVIFLNGIPARPEELQTAVDYPRWLGILTRAVLIPLLGLCLVILYVYAVMIVTRGGWPKGGMAGGILCFSAAGILTYLLVYPVREKADGPLVPSFMRWFFPLVLPIAVLLFLSVWRRIADYGVTEIRYFGVLASAWLAAACVYFITGKAKNIKAVPASIALLGFVSSFGPWGAPAVSAQAQAARLEKILLKNGILSDGRIRPAAETVPAQDEGEISRIVRYLSERGEMDRIARWCEGGSTAESEQDVMARMGLFYDPSLRGKDIHFMARDGRSLKVAGYDYSVKLSAFLSSANETWEAAVDQPVGKKEGRYRLLLDGKAGKLFLTEGRDTVLAADIVPLVRKLRTEFRDDGKASPVRVPREKLEIAERRGFVGIKVCLSEIVGTEKEGTVRIGNVQGEVLVKTEP